jgi:hypothetical protein
VAADAGGFTSLGAGWAPFGFVSSSINQSGASAIGGTLLAWVPRPHCHLYWPSFVSDGATTM